MLSNKVTHRQLAGVALAVLLWSTMAHAQGTPNVVTLGANLTSGQRQQMLTELGAAQTARVLTINHQDEERLLSGVAPQSQIGTRSISSSAVTLEGSGYGIHVTTRDITWVTPAMYANALATAGVKNAKVAADAPFPVSGTAALAGILTAYQTASGSTIPLSQQRTAAQEMMVTGNLGDQIGSKSKAAMLVMQVKNTVIQNHLTTSAAIRPVVVNEANRLNINLTNTQIASVTNLMIALSRLPLDAQTLTSQLHSWEQKAAGVVPPGLWQQITLWLSRIWHAIQSLLHGG